MARSGGVKPDRAHTGNGLTGGCPAHPFAAGPPAGLALPAAALPAGPLARDAGGCDPAGAWPPLVHAAAASMAATAATIRATRCLMI
jgi:hypothetical protein